MNTSRWLALGLLAAGLFILPLQGADPAACSGGTVNFANTSITAVSNALTLTRVPAGSRFLAALHYLPDTGAEMWRVRTMAGGRGRVAQASAASHESAELCVFTTSWPPAAR